MERTDSTSINKMNKMQIAEWLILWKCPTAFIRFEHTISSTVSPMVIKMAFDWEKKVHFVDQKGSRTEWISILCQCEERRMKKKLYRAEIKWHYYQFQPLHNTPRYCDFNKNPFHFNGCPNYKAKTVKLIYRKTFSKPHFSFHTLCGVCTLFMQRMASKMQGFYMYETWSQ